MDISIFRSKHYINLFEGIEEQGEEKGVRYHNFVSAFFRACFAKLGICSDVIKIKERGKTFYLNKNSTVKWLNRYGENCRNTDKIENIVRGIFRVKQNKMNPSEEFEDYLPVNDPSKNDKVHQGQFCHILGRYLKTKNPGKVQGLLIKNT